MSALPPGVTAPKTSDPDLPPGALPTANDKADDNASGVVFNGRPIDSIDPRKLTNREYSEYFRLKARQIKNEATGYYEDDQEPLSEAALAAAEMAARPFIGKQTKKTEQTKMKPARRQVKKRELFRYQREEGFNELNIWYDRYYDNQERAKSEKATTRCNSKLDQGLTAANNMKENAFHCYHFAKGCCDKGAECIYLHRVPTEQDCLKLDSMHDIFGRERHATDRDDMGGIGSFNRDLRTLYVNSFYFIRAKKQAQTPSRRNPTVQYNQDVNIEACEEVLARHFGEWGLIEEISVKPRYGCAFIRYKHRASAEFAKVAMSDQSLDNNEQINVRWAFDDPNPKVKERIAFEQKTRFIDAVKAKGFDLNELSKANYTVPTEYKLPPPKPPGISVDSAEPPTKRARLQQTSAVEWYPDTDQQYQQAQAQAQYAYADPNQQAYAQGYAQQGYAQGYGQTGYGQQGYYAADGAYQYYDAAQAQQQQAQPSQQETYTGAGPHLPSSAGPQAPSKEAAEAQKRQQEAQTAMDKMNKLLNVIDNTST